MGLLVLLKFQNTVLYQSCTLASSVQPLCEQQALLQTLVLTWHIAVDTEMKSIHPESACSAV